MSKKPAPESKPATSLAWYRNPSALPLMILGLVAAGVVAAVVVSNFKQDPYSEARTAANAFMQAFVNCDYATAKKYYVVFQTDAQKSADYKKSCTPGGSFTFNRQVSASTETKQGTTTKNVGYLFNLKTQGYNGGLMVYMEWLGSGHKWVVFSLSATSLSQNAASGSR